MRNNISRGEHGANSTIFFSIRDLLCTLRISNFPICFTPLSNDGISHLERERNARRHLKRVLAVEQMIKLTDKAFSNRVSSLKYASDHKLGGLMCRWFEVKGD